MVKRIFEKKNHWYYYFRLNGVSVRQSTRLQATRANRPEATRIMEEAINQHRLNSEWYAHKNLTLGEALELYYNSLNVQEYTLHTYKKNLSIFQRFMANDDIPVNKITEKDINRFYSKLETQSHNTKATYMRQIRIFFQYLLKTKKVVKNPVPNIKPIQTPIVIIPPHIKERIFAYLEEKNPPAYTFVKIMDFTGMRPGEVMKLRWEQFDFHLRVLNIWNNKEGRNDTFPLYTSFFNFMITVPMEGERLFPMYNHRDSIKFWRRACQVLNIEGYSIYDIRRTFGTDVAPSMTEVELAALMRHRNIETTRRFYVHINLKATGEKIDR